jgi:hypothetical protein
VTDLATLSLAIDSRGMDAGLNKLDQFQSKAKETESAARNLQQQLDKAFRINVQGGGDRAADIAEYGRELDRLREKYVPLAALERQHAEALQEIAMAARVGAISEQERVAAIANVNKAFQNNATVMRAAGGTAKLTGDQFRMLGFQINDIVSGLAMGQSPFMVMTQQGGQVYQVLGQGPTGVGGALNAIGASLGRLATSTVGVFGIATAAAVGFGLVLNKITDDQRNLERALTTGLGRGAGVSVDTFRQITDAAASAAQVSKSTAQEIGLAFAQTGKIGGALFGDLTVLASRFGLTVGVDAVEAAKELGKAFADPLRGMEMIEKRVGALDDATREYVRNAVLVGDTFGAQQALARGLENALVKLPTRIETIGDAWTRLKNAVSNGAAAVLGIATLSERIQGAEAELANLQRSMGSGFGASEGRVRASMEKLSKLYEEQAEATRKAREEQERLQKNNSDKAIRDATEGHVLEMQAIAAKTEVEKAAIAGQRAYTQAIESGLNARAAQVLQINAEERALAMLRASIDQTINGYKDQAAAARLGAGILGSRGGNTGVANAAMERYTALAQLQREIDAADGATKEELKQKYKELAAAIDENTAARARLQAAQAIDALKNEAELLRIRINLWGEESREIERAIALKQVEQRIRAENASPAEAEQWRRRAREVENLKDELAQLNENADKGVSSAERLAGAWKGVGEAIQQAGYIMSSTNWQTGIDAMLGGGGGTRATGGSFAYYSSDFLSNAAYKANAAMNGTNGANDNARKSELQNLISSLERSIERAGTRWDNYQPSAYAEKNPLLFYDFQSGDHFSAAEKAQIKKMEEQLEVARKQLAALERLEQQRQAVQSSGLPQNINRMEAMNFFQRDPRAFSQFYNMTSGGFGLRFATGGSFMVGGNGGTDTTPVSFMATKGERVTVETPAQQRSNATPPVVNDNRDQRTINLTVQVVADPNGGGDPKLAGDRMARDIAERLRRIA